MRPESPAEARSWLVAVRGSLPGNAGCGHNRWTLQDATGHPHPRCCPSPRETNGFMKTPLPAAIISNQSSVAAHHVGHELKVKKTPTNKKPPLIFLLCMCMHVCV